MDSKQLSEYVGKKIHYYRKRLGITQKELGEKIGVKHNTVSDYERGKISPEQDVLFALSGVFGIRVDDLFPHKENTTNELERALRMTSEMNLKDAEFLNQLIERALSLSEEDRGRFLESIRFTVEFHDKMRNE